MFKNIRNKIVALLSLALLVTPLAVPALVSAQTSNSDISNNLCEGATLNLNATTTSDACGAAGAGAGADRVNDIIHNVINIFSLVVGIVSVIMIIVGGFRYITSGGDTNNVSGAKNTIIYAIIGLVVVALAQFIVQFVLNKVTQ